MASLPDDVFRHIFSYLPRDTLAQCRYLSQSVEPLARAFLFRHARLEIGWNVDVFLNIASSERLRPFVRELTVDLSQDLRPDTDGAKYAVRVEQRRQTLMAVPLVRLFSGLRTLNLRFGQSQSHPEDTIPEESGSPTLPSIYTEEIIQCICGRWTKESQDQWVRRWRKWYRRRAEAIRILLGGAVEASFSGLLRDWEGDYYGAMQQFPDTAINLSALTISNVSEQDSEYLMSSETLRHFFATQSLSTLQLLTSSGRHAGDNFDRGGPMLHNRYKFSQNLLSTWLSPPVADRLRTLSLYAQEHWGWIPKMDLRALGRLPNLRTLALGMYVFTHQWQVDWVAQLGSDNGRGGLEELYLDNCPIMWRGRVLGPVDEEGFPLEEVMIQSNFHPDREHVVVEVDLRWSAVLDQWRQKMPSLKVFRMGSGDWDGAYSTQIAMAQNGARAPITHDADSMAQTDFQEGADCSAYLRRKRRTVDTMHLNYDKPPVDALYQHGPEAIRDGVGLRQGRAFLLPYIQFEVALGSQQWVERDFKDALLLEFEDGWQRYMEVRRQDEDALDALYASTGAHEYRAVAQYQQAWELTVRGEVDALEAVTRYARMPREDDPGRSRED